MANTNKRHYQDDEDTKQAKTKLVELTVNTPKHLKRELGYIRERDAFLFAASDSVDFICKEYHEEDEEDKGDPISPAEFFIRRQMEYDRSIKGQHVLSVISMAELELGNNVDDENEGGFEPPR